MEKGVKIYVGVEMTVYWMGAVRCATTKTGLARILGCTIGDLRKALTAEDRALRAVTGTLGKSWYCVEVELVKVGGMRGKNRGSGAAGGQGFRGFKGKDGRLGQAE